MMVTTLGRRGPDEPSNSPLKLTAKRRSLTGSRSACINRAS